MSELDHPHIVHLEEVYEDQETACFVMELAKGGEVFQMTAFRHLISGETEIRSLPINVVT